MLAAVRLMAADPIVWVSLPFVAPGTTGAKLYYSVSMPSAGSILIERYVPPVSVDPSFTISQIQASPIAGTNRWCLGATSTLRVALLGRVTQSGQVETLVGTPAWIRNENGCGLALALPSDTLSVHAVVVDLQNAGGG